MLCRGWDFSAIFQFATSSCLSSVFVAQQPPCGRPDPPIQKKDRETTQLCWVVSPAFFSSRSTPICCSYECCFRHILSQFSSNGSTPTKSGYVQMICSSRQTMRSVGGEVVAREKQAAFWCCPENDLSWISFLYYLFLAFNPTPWATMTQAKKCKK